MWYQRVAEDRPPGTDWLTGRTLSYDVDHEDALIYLDARGRERFAVVGNPNASGTEAEGRDIERALATLVEEQRAVLLLVMLEGLSYREVADIQGVPIGTVMSRLARARAHVKAALEGVRPSLRRVK